MSKKVQVKINQKRAKRAQASKQKKRAVNQTISKGYGTPPRVRSAQEFSKSIDTLTQSLKRNNLTPIERAIAKGKKDQVPELTPEQIVDGISKHIRDVFMLFCTAAAGEYFVNEKQPDFKMTVDLESVALEMTNIDRRYNLLGKLALADFDSFMVETLDIAGLLEQRASDLYEQIEAMTPFIQDIDAYVNATVELIKTENPDVTDNAAHAAAYESMGYKVIRRALDKVNQVKEA